MLGFLKKTASKADEAIDQASKDMTTTANKVQKALDESGKSVTVIINAMLITMGVSILANIVGILLNIHKNKQMKMPKIIIQNLYLK